ncbi:hypothetical protein [Cupriavidus malaysiensis]|nr:hypothetical protein [Cupriavidus malaysiensis]
MAKTRLELLSMMEEAAGRCTEAAEACGHLHALLQAIAELSDGDAVISGLADLGAGLALELSGRMHGTGGALQARVRIG